MKRYLIFSAAVLMTFCFCRRIKEFHLSGGYPEPGTFQQISLVRSEFDASSSGILRLKTGELAMVFKGFQGPAVSRHDRVVFLSRSADGGRTWGEPKSILTGLWGFNDPALLQLPEGRVVLIYGWSAGAVESSGPMSAGFFISLSDDDGNTFTVPRLVHVPKAYWVATSEDVLHLEDGTLLAPLTVGKRNGETTVLLAVSTDKGAKWERFLKVSGDSLRASSFQKPALARLSDRRLLCLMEGGVADPYLYATRSADDGATWEKPRNTGVQGKEPALAVTSNGTLLCAFRDRWPEGISLVRSYDRGISWEGETQALSLDAGNPSPHLALLPADLLLIAYESREKDGKTGVKGLLFVDDPPSAPAGLSGSFKPDRNVHLRWNSVKQAAYYIVYRDTSAAFVLMADTVMASRYRGTSVEPRFIDRGTDTLKTYRYRVSAVRTFGRPVEGTGGESEPCAAVSVKYR
jgi:hypothetical protein